MKWLQGKKHVVDIVLYNSLLVFLALYFTSKYLLLRSAGISSPVFERHLTEDAIRWFPWPLLIPLALALGNRFPILGEKKALGVLIHLGGSLGTSLLHPAIVLLLVHIIPGPWRIGSGVVQGSWVYGGIFIQFLHVNIIKYWIIIGVQGGFNHIRRLRERELKTSELESQLAKAELRNLAVQIHPHFLFNTLHLISSLVYQNPRAADRIISRLSDLLRSTLNQSSQETTLLEEIDVLDNYIEIMKTRFGEQLNIAVNIHPETMGALIPHFILQPLVENAIQHGTISREEGGEIRISSARRNGKLVLEIEDNGPGFDGEPESLMDKGFGLRSTRERLRGLYGEAASLGIRNGPGGGAHVTLALPFHTEALKLPGGVR